jgi:hypothetical protein
MRLEKYGFVDAMGALAQHLPHGWGQIPTYVSGGVAARLNQSYIDAFVEIVEHSGVDAAKIAPLFLANSPFACVTISAAAWFRTATPDECRARLAHMRSGTYARKRKLVDEFGWEDSLH